MKRMKQAVKKLIHPIFIVAMLCIIIAGVIIIKNNQQSYASETWVHEYLTAYSDNLSDLDIKVLSKNLSNEIDEKIEKIDFESDISEEQLMGLMTMVNEELQYADYSIPQEEITKISADIVKRIVAEYASEEYATSHKLADSVDVLENQLSTLKNTVTNLEHKEKSELSEEQMREIAKQSGLDEATVMHWIENGIAGRHDKAIDELADALGINAEELRNITEQAESMDDSMTYLITRLGITEEKLREALSKTDATDNKTLSILSAQLNDSKEQLQQQIDNNMSLTTNGIAAVQQQISNNRTNTDAAIISSKNDALAAVADSSAKMSKEIGETKKKTDTEIKELQDNVLFYEYEESTNTLKLFKSTGEDEDEKTN